MTNISRKSWNDYVKKLSRISDKATAELFAYLNKHDTSTKEGMKDLIDYAYALATKYGEASSALACEIYDSLAVLSGEIFPPAEPAATATYGEVARDMYGTNMLSPEVTASTVGRRAKLAAVDTIMKNAIANGDEWAWIPSGATCAFCITLASRGWQRATKDALKNGHADHVHSNCDCMYAVRHNENINVEGYNPEEYLDMYETADGNTPKERINALRREFYAKNKDSINEQKRAAYRKKIERESTEAEEIDVE